MDEQKFQYMVIFLEVESGEVAGVFGSNNLKEIEGSAERVPEDHQVPLSKDTILQSVPTILAHSSPG
jgi:hypothetical protein